MNNQERVERLNRMVSEGRIIRKQWTDGKERACLLAALSPEAGEQQSASACPAFVMPRWLANLTPLMDDNGSEAAWAAFVKRYAAVAARWHVLSPEQWRRADHAVRAHAVREAMKHTTFEDTLKACEQAASLNEKAAAGETIDEEAWSAARSAAESAARSAAESAAWSAARSAAASASAAWSAAESAAWSAAESAAWSAAEWSAAWSAAESAAWSAAESAAWDRLNDAILTILEDHCTVSEQSTTASS